MSGRTCSRGCRLGTYLRALYVIVTVCMRRQALMTTRRSGSYEIHGGGLLFRFRCVILLFRAHCSVASGAVRAGATAATAICLMAT